MGVGRRRWRKPTRVGLGAAGVASMASMALASVAFACTSIMAAMTITPTAGGFGKATAVTTNVTKGLKHGATYQVHVTVGLSTQGADCMEMTGVVALGNITTNSVGGWSNVKVTIPANSTRGAHGVCAVEISPIKMQTGTTHDTFTVS